MRQISKAEKGKEGRELQRERKSSEGTEWIAKERAKVTTGTINKFSSIPPQECVPPDLSRGSLGSLWFGVYLPRWENKTLEKSTVVLRNKEKFI